MSDTLVGLMETRRFAYTSAENQYPGFIPLKDVNALFDWSPRKTAVAYAIPCDIQVADMLDPEGIPVRIVFSKQNRMGVLRDDNDYDLGIFRSGAVHPPYRVTLIKEAERLIGTTLGVTGASVLHEGGKAYVEFAMPEINHDRSSGLDFRPNLLRVDSMDGSMSLTTCLTIEAMICGNRLNWNLRETHKSERQSRRKHTRNVLAGLDSERAALGILETITTEFTEGLHAMLAQPVCAKRRLELMELIVPVPERNGRARTMAMNKRDELMALDSNAMVAPFVGNAFGEVQRYNTWRRHFSQVVGADRDERNALRLISGRDAEADREVLSALQTVLA